MKLVVDEADKDLFLAAGARGTADRAFFDAHPVQSVVRHDGVCFAFSGDRHPDDTCTSLGLGNVTLVKELSPAPALR